MGDGAGPPHRALRGAPGPGGAGGTGGHPHAHAAVLAAVARAARPDDGGSLGPAGLAGGPAPARPHRRAGPPARGHRRAPLLCLCKLWLPADDLGALFGGTVGLSAGAPRAATGRGGHGGARSPGPLLRHAHPGRPHPDAPDRHPDADACAAPGAAALFLRRAAGRHAVLPGAALWRHGAGDHVGERADGLAADGRADDHHPRRRRRRRPPGTYRAAR